MRSERGLSTIQHCLQWYKLLLRSRSYNEASVAYRYLIIILFYLYFFGKIDFFSHVYQHYIVLRTKCPHLVRCLSKEKATYTLFYVRFCSLCDM